MSNKTSDKNVATEEDVKVLKDLMEELKLEKQTDLHNNEYGEYITECDVLDLYDKQILALQHILAEREQKDKRIQELENKLQDINTYILINGIDESLRTATQIRVENQHEYMIQQKINKLEEERDHWHGCFIVAMENSIPKQEVKDKIKDLEEQYRQVLNENSIKSFILKCQIEAFKDFEKELLKGEK